MKKIFKKLFSVVFLFFLKINLVLAQSNWYDASGEEPARFSDLEIIFKNILNIILSLAGLGVFVMLIVGGFKFLTAGGNPENAAKAKGVITWAIIGLIVMLMVWFVMKLIEEFTGAEVTVFEIPGSS